MPLKYLTFIVRHMMRVVIIVVVAAVLGVKRVHTVVGGHEVGVRGRGLVAEHMLLIRCTHVACNTQRYY